MLFLNRKLMISSGRNQVIMTLCSGRGRMNCVALQLISYLDRPQYCSYYVHLDMLSQIRECIHNKVGFNVFADVNT